MSDYIVEFRKFEDSTISNKDQLNLNIRYGEVHALIVEKDIEKEEFTRFISGNYQDGKGEILYKGKRLGKDIFEVNEIKTLYKYPTMINSFTVAENLCMEAYPHKKLSIDWIEVYKKSRKLLEDLHFDLDYNDMVYDISPEKKKLVAIARVFLQNPEIIIMHEPTVGLDSDSVHNLYQIIQQYKKKNSSILYITKQWEEVLKIADMVSVLVDGRIEGPFSATAVKKDPKVLLNTLGNYKYEKRTPNESDEVFDAVFKAAKYLTSEYELKDVLLLLAKQASKTMHADCCIINLIDESTDTIIDTLEYKNIEGLVAEIKKEVILQLIKDKDIYYANKRNKEFSSLFDQISGVRTVICVPVLIRSQVAGLIQIIYRDYYVYSEDEFKYLTTFARQAALAIEDTRLMGRSALLQESHHRIKNNLQSIISLIDIQKDVLDKYPDMSLDNVLDSITVRIKSIAAVHDLLSRDKSARSIINIKNLINVLVEFIDFTGRVKVEYDLDDIFIPYNKASSIALVVNELIINCLKHAFPEDYSGKIYISCTRVDDMVGLIVSDNGVGVPQGINFGELQNMGLSIVESIINNDLKGKMELIEQDGLTVRIKLPVKRLVIGLNQ